MSNTKICLLTPNNFSHKAGDGVKTRKREIRYIHPALQANPGATQCTYLLEQWECKKDFVRDKQVIEIKHTEVPCFFDDRDKGWGEKTTDYCPTQRANRSGIKVINNTDIGYRIRKLTPKECWRLMGFSDEDFENARNAGVSNTQLYKQAGNSIVTDVLYHIFKELYSAMPYLFDDLKVGSYFSGIGAFEIGLNRLFEDIDKQKTSVENPSLDSSGGSLMLVYDDYNSRVRSDQSTIGTLTTNCGESATRAGWKIIEVTDKD